MEEILVNDRNEPVYITEIQLRNCQSIADCTIPLSRGLNVVVGPNSAGKTVLFKLIKICCTQGTRFHKKVKDVIRRKCGEAVCLFHFSDGSCGGVKLQPKLVQYVYRPDTESGYLIRTHPIPEFLEKMSLVVEDNFILNLLDADQELLLVNSSTKTNFNLVKLMAHNSELDRAKDQSELEFKKYTEWQLALNRKVDTIDSMLSMNEYVDTTQLESAVGDSELLMPLAQEVMTMLNLSDDLSFEVASDPTPLAPVVNLLGDLEDLCKLSNELEFAESLPEHVEALMDVAQAIEQLYIEASKLDLEGEQMLGQEVGHLLQSLTDVGLVVTCPVKGDVVYCEEASCVHCGFGSSQKREESGKPI